MALSSTNGSLVGETVTVKVADITGEGDARTAGVEVMIGVKRGMLVVGKGSNSDGVIVDVGDTITVTLLHTHSVLGLVFCITLIGISSSKNINTCEIIYN